MEKSKLIQAGKLFTGIAAASALVAIAAFIYKSWVLLAIALFASAWFFLRAQMIFRRANED